MTVEHEAAGGTRRAWKFLNERSHGMITGFPWPVPPSAGVAGPWVEVVGPLEDCVRGVHACRPGDLGWWLSAQLWAIELDGDHVEGRHAVVASRGRLLHQVEGWPTVGDELAVWAVWRSRDRTAQLWQAVDPGVAAALREATDLDELAAVVGALPQTVGAAGHESAALLAGQLRARGNPVSACAGAAHSAGHHALATGGGPPDIAFDAERTAQSRWLVERLALG